MSCKANTDPYDGKASKPESADRVAPDEESPKKKHFTPKSSVPYVAINELRKSYPNFGYIGYNLIDNTFTLTSIVGVKPNGEDILGKPFNVQFDLVKKTAHQKRYQ